MEKPVAISLCVLAVSVALLVSGAITQWNLGIIADENNLTTAFTPVLWLPFGIGLIGFIVSLPWFLATVTNASRAKGEY